MGEISPLTPDTPRMPARTFTVGTMTVRVMFTAGNFTFRVIEFTSRRTLIPGLLTAAVLNPLVIGRDPEYAIADDFHQEQPQDMPQEAGHAAIGVQINSTSGGDGWQNNSVFVAADKVRQRAERDHSARIAATSMTSTGYGW